MHVILGTGTRTSIHSGNSECHSTPNSEYKFIILMSFDVFVDATVVPVEVNGDGKWLLR
jgi:hypothetical protein